MSDPDRPAEALTIMVTQVEGSTAVPRPRGDRDEVLRVHRVIARDQIRACGGQERKDLGDGFLLSFPAPPAAVRCAVGIQRATAEHNADDPSRQVRVRIGIHADRVNVVEGELYGQAVHAAARITAQAAGGRILVSEAVRRQAEPELPWEFVDSGLFWLKGFRERWRLFDVVWGRPERTERTFAGAAPLTPLVGREAQLANLRGAVDETLAGHGSLALIAGEAGVGKSRLAAEIGAEAESRGMRVLTGHCVEMSGAAPYLPYVEIIEQATASPRSPLALRAALGDVAPEIARIAPVLRRVYPDIAPPLDLPPDTARRYLWNSFGEFLVRAAKDAPLLLVIEDLHWADESTVLLTEYVASALPRIPVLMLGTYRDDEVDISSDLARIVGQLERRRLVDRIGLRPLSARGVRAMVAALAGAPAPEALVRMIEDETEGNPFFVEELYLHLVESGRAAGERVGDDPTGERMPVPESVRMVLGKRLDRLSTPTRRALAAAAVAGRFFAPDLVGEMAGADGDGLVDAFDEAERARLVQPVRGDGQFVFGHELIRQTLLSELSTLRREGLHRRAADAIERLYADDVAAHAGDLAHHLSHAGRSADPARLVRYLTLAGERAAEAAAWGDAVAHFERALSLLAPGAREGRAELLERLAGALRSVGRWEDALRATYEALDLFEPLGRTDAIGRLSWSMVYQLTWSARLAEAVQAAKRALAALGDIASADRARLLGALAWALSVGGDHDRAVGLFGQARSLAEQVGDERALADVLHMETSYHLGYVELEQGVRAGLRAAEVFERERALWDLCSVQAFVIYEDGALGSREQARRLADPTRAVAERLGHLGVVFLLLADRVREAVTQADVATVETLAPQIVDVCERGGLAWLYIGYLYVGLAAHWRGDAEHAEAQFRRAVAAEPPGAFAGRSASMLAWHLAHYGRAEEVMALYESARPALPSLDRVNSIGAWNSMLSLVEALFLCGLRDQAAALAPLVDKALQTGPEWLTLDGRLIRTRAAIAAAADGRHADAERHFAQVQQDAQRLGLRLELTELRRLRARTLLERGDPAHARQAAELLEVALVDYRAYGMPLYAEEVQRTLRQSASLWRPAPD